MNTCDTKNGCETEYVLRSEIVWSDCKEKMLYCGWVRYASNIQYIACVINVEVSIHHGVGLTLSVHHCACAEPCSFFNKIIWQELWILLLSAYCSNKIYLKWEREKKRKRGRRTFSFISLFGWHVSLEECIGIPWTLNMKYKYRILHANSFHLLHSPDVFVWNMNLLCGNKNSTELPRYQ